MRIFRRASASGILALQLALSLLAKIFERSRAKRSGRIDLLLHTERIQIKFSTLKQSEITEVPGLNWRWLYVEQFASLTNPQVGQILTRTTELLLSTEISVSTAIFT